MMDYTNFLIPYMDRNFNNECKSMTYIMECFEVGPS